MRRIVLRSNTTISPKITFLDDLLAAKVKLRGKNEWELQESDVRIFKIILKFITIT